MRPSGDDCGFATCQWASSLAHFAYESNGKVASMRSTMSPRSPYTTRAFPCGVSSGRTDQEGDPWADCSLPIQAHLLSLPVVMAPGAFASNGATNPGIGDSSPTQYAI